MDNQASKSVQLAAKRYKASAQSERKNRRKCFDAASAASFYCEKAPRTFILYARCRRRDCMRRLGRSFYAFSQHFSTASPWMRAYIDAPRIF
jgi:hypothetical protein